MLLKCAFFIAEQLTAVRFFCFKMWPVSICWPFSVYQLHSEKDSFYFFDQNFYYFWSKYKRTL